MCLHVRFCHYYYIATHAFASIMCEHVRYYHYYFIATHAFASIMCLHVRSCLYYYIATNAFASIMCLHVRSCLYYYIATHAFASIMCLHVRSCLCSKENQGAWSNVRRIAEPFSTSPGNWLAESLRKHGSTLLLTQDLTTHGGDGRSDAGVRDFAGRTMLRWRWLLKN